MQTAFQIASNGGVRNLPAQFRPFTADSYKTIKKRERKRAHGREETPKCSSASGGMGIGREMADAEVTSVRIIETAQDNTSGMYEQGLQQSLSSSNISAHALDASDLLFESPEGTLPDFDTFLGFSDSTSNLTEAVLWSSSPAPCMASMNQPSSVCVDEAVVACAGSTTDIPLPNFTDGTVWDNTATTTHTVDACSDSDVEIEMPASEPDAQRVREWTQEEDRLLRHLRSTAALPWRRIARYFTDADEAALRCRFKSLATATNSLEKSTRSKRGRGRPRKRKEMPLVAAEGGGKASTDSKRKRGRPRKYRAATDFDTDSAMHRGSYSEPRWVVDRIVDRVEERGRHYYRVKWEDTWEPVENLQDCADTAIAEFHLRRSL